MNLAGQSTISEKKVSPGSFLGLLLVCSLAFIVQCSGQSQAQPAAAVTPAPLEPISAQTLRYAVFPAPPYMIGVDDDQNTPTGIDVEIVQEIARSMDLQVEFIRCAWVRCLDLMETGKADILSSVYKKSEREQFLFYLDTPYLTELPIAFYYLKGQGYTANKYEDIYQFKAVGVLRGASYFEQFDKDPLVKKHTADTQDQLFPLLLKGRIDAMAGYIPTENYRIMTEGYADKVERSAYQYGEPANVYITLSKQSPHASRLREFDEINRQLIESGILTDIINKYYQLHS